MLTSIRKKINSQAGESIAETLVSLLIAALALVMLAGAMSASTNIVIRSRDKLNSYYDANEEEGIIKKDSDEKTGEMTISGSGVTTQSIGVYYFTNDKLGKLPVVSYKK